MADRMRDMLSKSSSRLRNTKGSVSHIGATPYRFRVHIFVSYAENLQNNTEVCVVWQKRAAIEATSVVKVREKKAVFRENLTMELTLFRRGGTDTSELKFDEKKVKLAIRKGGKEGKSVGKINLDLAQYIRGANSTVFADMKMSNGSLVVTKIEATMMHVGKKKGAAGSEACSEMTGDGTDFDSLFGDDDQDLGDLEIETTNVPDEMQMSPVSAGPEKKPSVDKKKDGRMKTVIGKAMEGSGSRRVKKNRKDSLKEDEALKNSPSLKAKIKNRMKGKNEDGKEKATDKRLSSVKDLVSSSSKSMSKSRSKKPTGGPDRKAEIAELKTTVATLKKDNAKLKKSKQAAMDEIEALRADLEACEVALEEAKKTGKLNVKDKAIPQLDMSKTLKEKDKKIASLEAQNEALLEELEEIHDGAVDSAAGVVNGEMNALKRKIEELEIALKREPQYMDVVNELKVTKVSLALANMEKEQALFALQSQNAANGYIDQQQDDYSDSE